VEVSYNREEGVIEITYRISVDEERMSSFLDATYGDGDETDWQLTDAEVEAWAENLVNEGELEQMFEAAKDELYDEGYVNTALCNAIPKTVLKKAEDLGVA
jgi:lysozyme family protein